jgi:hypothetical protein
VWTMLLVSTSRGADFNVSHFWPTSPPVIRSLIPFARTGEKTPCSKFRGVLPLASSGWIGTMPTVPLLRTNTPVTGR